MTLKLVPKKVTSADVAPADDFEIVGACDLPSPDTINIDEAVDSIFKVWGWPLIGGPSGRGWSYYSTAGRCGQLFKKSYDVAVNQTTRKIHVDYLQIGALFHVLEGLYYGGGLGNAYVLPSGADGRCGGLASDLLKLPGRRNRFRVPSTAADDLLAGLKALCEDDTMLSPDIGVVQVAEQIFDRHTMWWDHREDVTPLGVEVFAAHPTLGYTCRYDLIGRVGKDDPMLPTGVVAFEKKSAAWIDQKYIDGWNLDGEVLGQFLCWEPSGMAELFGPLTAIVVDIVGKGKTPDCQRVVLPPTLPAVKQHEKWIRWQQAEINLWRASNTYPQRFMNCRNQYGICTEFENCKLGLL